MRLLLFIALMLFVEVRAPAAPAPGATWVESWGTAQPLTQPRKRPPPLSRAATDSPAAAPAASPLVPYPAVLRDQTVRMIVRTSAGGQRLRLSFSNVAGDTIVRSGSVHVAISAGDSAIVASTDRRVTFGGRAELTLFPGALVVSDPVELSVPPLTEVAVSLHIPGPAPTNTVHALGLLPAYIVTGDHTAATALQSAQLVRSYFWLTGLSVQADRANAGAIIAFGDSITDGYATTPGRHAAWPDLLAAQLQSDPRTRGLAVVNAGISGNRIIRMGAGDAALARFDRDVLARPGAKWVILLEGINDINMSIIPGVPAAEHVTEEEIVEGLRQLIERAHRHGIKVALATIMPTKGLPFYTSRGEAMRTYVNRWIRTNSMADAVIDFDLATRDPADPLRLLPAYDPGDHVHPNDLGNQAMANVISPLIFASDTRRDGAAHGRQTPAADGR